MSVDCVEFIVPGKPVPKGRPRMGKRKPRTPGRTKAFETKVKSSALAVGARIQLGVIRADLEFVFALPKSQIGKGFEFRRPRTGTEDVDNLAKAILDGLNGIAFKDDRQVTDLSCRKRYAAEGEEAMTIVKLWSMD